MVTIQEVKDMRDAIRQLEQTEAQQIQAQQQIDIATARAWFNTLGINIQAATTRDEALTAFQSIEKLHQTETDRLRRQILGIKLLEANEKFKEIKRNG